MSNDLYPALVHHYPLNETSGTRTDAQSRNNLTSVNSVGYAVGRAGNAAQFTAASSQYLESTANNFGSGRGLALAGWVQLASKGANRTIAAKWDTSGNKRSYLLNYSNSADRFSFSACYDGTAATVVTVNADALGSPALGTWYFIEAGCYFGKIYIRVNRGTINTADYPYPTPPYTYPPPFIYLSNTPAPFRLGAHSGGEYWDGLIDEFTFYSVGNSMLDLPTFYTTPGGDLAFVSPLAANNLGNSFYADGTLKPVVGPAQLTSGVAGSGLTGGAGNPLAVNADGSTLEINGNTLRQKAGGTTNNELGSDVKIGSLAALLTTAKNTVVAAVNELKLRIDGHDTAIGTLASLATTAKNNLVAAINELKGRADSADSSISTNTSAISTLATSVSGILTRIAVALNLDGTLKDNSVPASAIQPGAVTGDKLAPDVLSNFVGYYDAQTGPFVFPTVTASLPAEYAEPGALGVLPVGDASHKYSISGGRLVASSAATDYSDPKLFDMELPRLPGLALRATVRGNFKIGFRNSADSGTTVRSGVFTNLGGFYALQNGSPLGGTALAAHSPTIDYQVLVALADTGANVYVKGGAWSNFTLLWAANFNDSGDLNRQGTVKPVLLYAGAIQWDTVSLAGLGGLWSREQGLADYSDDLPTTPVSYTATADGLVKCVFDMPANSVGKLQFRRSGPNDYWEVRLTQAVNQAALVEVNGGVDNFRDTKTATLTADGKFRCEVRFEGTNLYATVMGTNTVQLSYGSATFNQTARGVYIPATAATPTWLQVFQLAAPGIPPMSGPAPILFMPVGDSKTEGVGDDTHPGFISGGYPDRLARLLTTRRGAGAYERPARIAQGGIDTPGMLALLPTELAARANQPAPTHILVNLGANDRNPLPTASAFKSDYGDVLDLLHQTYPLAKILCALVWVQGTQPEADSATLNGWIVEVLKTRPWARVGINEFDILKGSDDGASETSDGIHPSAFGYDLTAEAWQASMGY